MPTHDHAPDEETGSTENADVKSNAPRKWKGPSLAQYLRKKLGE